MSLREREAKRAALLAHDLRLLVPIARAQARKAGRHGVTVDSVRLAADAKGILLASTDRAYLSALYSRVMIAAGLERVQGRYVRTMRRGTKGGNLCALWRAA